MNFFKSPAFTWGFSSMGAHELTLAQTLALAAEFGLDFVELRGLEGTLDLPTLLRDLPAGTVPKRPSVRIVGSSLRLTEAGGAEVAEFLRFAALAHRLKAPYVRVFGGGHWGKKISSAEMGTAVAAVAACRKGLAEHAPGVRMLLETHDTFSSAPACQRLNNDLDEPLEILWDTHHTWRRSGETPQESWNALGPLVRHIHYKDSVHRPTGESHLDRYAYVFPGEGEFPTAELLGLLGRVGYRGGISLEWEKLWCHELPPLREALPGFLRVRESASRKA